MRIFFTFVGKSYLKTTVTCFVVVAAALLLSGLCVYLLPPMLGSVLADFGMIAALVGASLAFASVVVLARYSRGVRGEYDLFLDLNRSRDVAETKVIAVANPSRVRRWFARRMLGHDFIVGDLVEIRPWEEIRATLDERACLDQLPFMPEMLAACGKRAQVLRCVHRIFDYRKTRRMRHLHGAVLLTEMVCDGSSHGGCEAACYTIWNAAWLRRVDANSDAIRPETGEHSALVAAARHLQFGTRPPCYSCQLTQLHAASRPIGNRSAINFLRPLVSGNVAPTAFAVGWATHFFNQFQHLRQGVGFPAFDVPTYEVKKPDVTLVKPGDHVIVRSAVEIRATLDNQSMHRGLYFESDMMKHCGREYRVQAEVTKLIDIVTGEMRSMKTPAFILCHVRFSGERQLFNSQNEPLFWRSVWLQRVGSDSGA